MEINKQIVNDNAKHYSKYDISLYTIFSYVETIENDRKKWCLKEGERVYKNNQIISCVIHNRSEQELIIVALCLKSSDLKGEPRKITCCLKREDRFNIECSCNLEKNVKCKHTVAVLIYINHKGVSNLQDFSSTNLNQERATSQLTLKSTFVASAPSYTPKKLENSPSKTNKLNKGTSNNAINEQADNSNENAVIWQCENENLVFDKLSNVEQLLQINDQKHRNFYEKFVRVSFLEAVKICSRTSNQGNGVDNEYWSCERRKRITGSTAYALYTYTEKKDSWSTKIDRHLRGFLFKGNSATQYGNINEPVAIQCYENVYGCKVFRNIGMVINPIAPWLSFSPDGIIFEHGKPSVLIEVKCPTKGKEQSTEELLKTNSFPFLTKKGNNIELRRNHKYYGQVQLGLAILNLGVCHFIVFNKKDNDFLKVVIEKDLDFIEKFLSKLEMVYFNHLLPKIANE